VSLELSLGGQDEFDCERWIYPRYMFCPTMHFHGFFKDGKQDISRKKKFKRKKKKIIKKNCYGA